MEGIQFPVEITVHNTCEPGEYDASTEMKWYNWSVFIQGPEDFIGKIEFVTYHLHPSFRKVDHDVHNRGDNTRNFELRSRGWGEFIIKVDINLQGRRKVSLQHYLTLTRNSATTTKVTENDLSRWYI
jgi:transcription initiation factor IIF auxiliary subunit